MSKDDKRQLRNLKREIKKAGNKRRRRFLNRALADQPEFAHEAEFEFGRDTSAGLNGIDNDATRRRETPESDD